MQTLDAFCRARVFVLALSFQRGRKAQNLCADVGDRLPQDRIFPVVGWGDRVSGGDFVFQERCIAANGLQRALESIAFAAQVLRQFGAFSGFVAVRVQSSV